MAHGAKSKLLQVKQRFLLLHVTAIGHVIDSAKCVVAYKAYDTIFKMYI